MYKIESHATEALDRLCELFKAQANVRALVTAWCGPIQSFEEVLYQVLTERAVDNAVGVQLDQLGVIVGQERAGLSDDDYRRYIRARIRVNRSSGTINELTTITRLIVDDDDASIQFDPSYPAAGMMRVSGIPFDTATALALVTFLRAAAAGGVRIVLEWSTVAPEDTFFWDTTDWDDGLIWVTSTE